MPKKAVKSTVTKKKRKKKKGHYKTGIHIAKKCVQPIKYRSSWELTVAIHLDNDPTVKSFEYESVKIPYMLNVRTRKIRNYIPDFIVQYIDGRKVIIEVKRTSALNNLIVMKKASAAREWAAKNGMEYVFWTNKIIEQLQKIQKHQLLLG